MAGPRPQAAAERSPADEIQASRRAAAVIQLGTPLAGGLGGGNNVFREYRPRNIDLSLRAEDHSAGLNGLPCFTECSN
jgi:hypothetical protein